MPDNPSPRRRWYQFRLSTWFVVVAILAWWMVCGPLYSWIEISRTGTPVVITSTAEGYISPTHRTLTKHGPDANGQIALIKYRRGFNRRLIWPPLALATFVGWKAAWGMFERRRAIRSETHW